MKQLNDFYQALSEWDENDPHELQLLLNEAVMELFSDFDSEMEDGHGQQDKLEVDSSIVSVMFFLLKLLRIRGVNIEIVMHLMEHKLSALTFGDKPLMIAMQPSVDNIEDIVLHQGNVTGNNLPDGFVSNGSLIPPGRYNFKISTVKDIESTSHELTLPQYAQLSDNEKLDYSLSMLERIGMEQRAFEIIIGHCFRCDNPIFEGTTYHKYMDIYLCKTCYLKLSQSLFPLYEGDLCIGEPNYHSVVAYFHNQK